MVTPAKPQSELTDQGQRILTHLRSIEGWCTRRALAAMLGRNALNPHDRQLLEQLADAGVIEVKTRPSSRPHMTEYLYRVKEQA